MQDVKAATRNKRQNARGDFVGIVSPDFRPALDAKRLSAAREKQPQIIVNLRGSRNSRTRVARGIFLPNGHRRSDAGDFVDIRFFHALEKLARVSGQRFDITALAFGVNGVEGERGFAGAADAGDHGNALCGISTLMFLRLWTRAPRTQIDSCSGRTSVVAWVISLVAKSKPRQRVSSALPKLQIILPLSKRSKRGVVGTTSRLLAEGDLADATLHFQVYRRGGFAIGIVYIGVYIVLQTVDVGGADAAGSVSNDTDIFRKADVGLSNAAFNIGGQVGLAVSGDVDIHLEIGRAHV